MYPPNFNLYRCSKGIKKPDITMVREFEAQKKVKAATLTFERTVKVETSTGYENTLNYRYFNMVTR